MALTYSTVHRYSQGNVWNVILNLTPASSDYPTGGYVLDATANGSLPDSTIRAVIPLGISTTAKTASYTSQFNYTTGKLQVFGGAASAVALAEVANGADLSAYVFTVLVVGK